MNLTGPHSLTSVQWDVSNAAKGESHTTDDISSSVLRLIFSVLTFLNWCLLRSQRKVPRYIDSVACLCSFESPGLSNVAGERPTKKPIPTLSTTLMWTWTEFFSKKSVDSEKSADNERSRATFGQKYSFLVMWQIFIVSSRNTGSIFHSWENIKGRVHG